MPRGHRSAANVGRLTLAFTVQFIGRFITGIEAAGGLQFFCRRVILVETLGLVFDPRRLDAHPFQIDGD